MPLNKVNKLKKDYFSSRSYVPSDIEKNITYFNKLFSKYKISVPKIYVDKYISNKQYNPENLVKFRKYLEKKIAIKQRSKIKEMFYGNKIAIKQASNILKQISYFKKACFEKNSVILESYSYKEYELLYKLIEETNNEVILKNNRKNNFFDVFYQQNKSLALKHKLIQKNIGVIKLYKDIVTVVYLPAYKGRKIRLNNKIVDISKGFLEKYVVTIFSEVLSKIKGADNRLNVLATIKKTISRKYISLEEISSLTNFFSCFSEKRINDVIFMYDLLFEEYITKSQNVVIQRSKKIKKTKEQIEKEKKISFLNLIETINQRILPEKDIEKRFLVYEQFVKNYKKYSTIYDPEAIVRK
jgi:hypothetical protein